jgi:hypothetical protein
VPVEDGPEPARVDELERPQVHDDGILRHRGRPFHLDVERLDGEHVEVAAHAEDDESLELDR